MISPLLAHGIRVKIGTRPQDPGCLIHPGISKSPAAGTGSTFFYASWYKGWEERRKKGPSLIPPRQDHPYVKPFNGEELRIIRCG